MTMLQNESREARPNVLHDQGVPNTLAGLPAPATAPRFRLFGGLTVAAIAGLVALLAILLGRAT